MGATKEKRIKKLKKLQIWPAIVGLILLMIVSSALIGLTAIFSITDIAQKNFDGCIAGHVTHFYGSCNRCMTQKN